jgi:hypothetical protein
MLASLQLLASEFVITVTNADVWLSMGLALLLGGGCLAFGAWLARTVGLLRSDAPAGETIAVGLASGLMVFAAWWAAIWSGGRSSFTPVAIGFAVSAAVAVVHRVRHPPTPSGEAAASRDGTRGPFAQRRTAQLTILASAVFVVTVALLYGSTMAPSPRDGGQPVENNDEAFYAVLGRDLATTGTETNNLPSGFSEIPGAPPQTWYHWGELWLASAVIEIFGVAPMWARFMVVLPLVLLAAAALTGTLVRRFARTNSRRAYVFGFLACLFLAPVPLIPGPFFSSWAVGLIFGITLYGLAAVAVLLALYAAAVMILRPASWALAGFVGSTVAMIVPAHVVIALLTLVGVVGVGTIRVIRSLVATRSLPSVPPLWRGTLVVTGVTVVATVVWGTLTGHGVPGGVSVGTSGTTIGVNVSPGVAAFNAAWRDSVAITILGAGVFFSMPLAWLLVRRRSPLHADLYVGAAGVLAAGALAWGARLGDFTMFYFYFAGIGVIATPTAAVAVRTLWQHLRTRRYVAISAGLAVLSLIQLELGVAAGIVRLQGFGPYDYPPIPTALLAAIRELPTDAKLAYSCGPFDEVAAGTPRLLSIDAHAGRRVVPMCFEAEFPNTLIGSQSTDQVASQFFTGAPQAALYPDAAASPSAAVITRFLKDHVIDYIYVDDKHPNILLPDAIAIATSAHAEVLKVP